MKPNVLVFMTSTPGKYLVGDSYTKVDEVRDRVNLENPVQMNIQQKPEGDGKHVFLNPLLVFEQLTVDVRSYEGFGYLKGELKEKFEKWKYNRETHDQIFKDDD